MKTTIMVEQTTYIKQQQLLPFNVPTKPLYLFMYGNRICIRVIPEFYEENVYSLSVTIVHPGTNCKITMHKLYVTYFGEILKAGGLMGNVLELIDSYQPRNLRTAEDFELDLQNVLHKIKAGI